MKLRHTFTMVFSSLLITSTWGEEVLSLSDQKQRYYEFQQHQIDAGYDKLRYDWLSPITLKASNMYEKSASFGTKDTRQTLSAGIAQDLFRSGGITYSIEYAKTKKEADTLALDKEIANINQQLVNAVLTYRKNAIVLQQSDLKLKNAKIEIFLKRKQYEAGDIDITLLNNALMSQSNELKNNTALRYALIQQKYEASKLSNISIESVFITRLYTLHCVFKSAYPGMYSRNPVNAIRKVVSVMSKIMAIPVATNTLSGRRLKEAFSSSVSLFMITRR